MDPDLAGQLRTADQGALGERIRNLRLAKGLTQTQLAGGKVTVGYISRIEAGDRRPDVALVEMFAKLLDSTSDYLITGVTAEVEAQWTLALLNAEMALETGDAVDAVGIAENLQGENAAVSVELQRRAAFIRARGLEVLGQLDDAIIELERVVETGGPGEWILPSLIALSRCYRESGDLNRAIEVGETGLSRLAAAGVDGGDEAIRLTVTVASAYFERGDVGHAVRIARGAIERADEIGSSSARAAAYWNASIYESERGALVPAIALAERALTLLGEGEDRRNLARLHGEVGLMMMRLDPPDTPAAERHLKRARRDLASFSGSAIDLATCDVGLAQARAARGDAVGARTLASSVLESVGEIAPTLAAAAAAVLGRAAVIDGDRVGAIDHYRTAIGYLTGTGQDRGAAQLWLDLGAELDQLGDAETARDAYRRAAVASGLRISSTLRTSVVRD